jgi:hypothetical protein
MIFALEKRKNQSDPAKKTPHEGPGKENATGSPISATTER